MITQKFKKIIAFRFLNNQIGKSVIHHYLSFDCGVFSCYNIFRVLEGNNNNDIKQCFKYDKNYMKSFRKRLYYITVILECFDK